MGRALIRQFTGVDRRRRIIEAVGFTPLELAPVSSWFRVAAGTITGSGYSSIPDLLSPSSPMTQSTDARRPPAATSSNGLPILSVTASNMAIPLIASRINTAAWGWWGWIRPSTTADGFLNFGTQGGASAEFMWLTFTNSGTNLHSEVWATAGGSRVRNIVGSITAGAWQFVTAEYNSALSGDARYTVTVNGTPIAGTNGGSLGSMPAALPAVTGSGNFLSFQAIGNFPYVGSVGPNFGFMNAAMSGATEGLLTAAARTNLMNFEAPS